MAVPAHRPQHRHCCAGLLALGFALSGAALFVPASAAASTAPVEDGAALFASSGCTQCHGPAGLGTEKGPSLRDVRKRLSEAQMQHQIHDGGQAMPAFGDALTQPQIGSLIAFLRSKKAWSNAH